MRTVNVPAIAVVVVEKDLSILRKQQNYVVAIRPTESHIIGKQACDGREIAAEGTFAKESQIEVIQNRWAVGRNGLIKAEQQFRDFPLRQRISIKTPGHIGI